MSGRTWNEYDIRAIVREEIKCEVFKLRPSLLDVSKWTRLAEVDEYAEYVHTDRATAIEQLVNGALSYGMGAPKE
jgi:hypothetical protein